MRCLSLISLLLVTSTVSADERVIQIVKQRTADAIATLEPKEKELSDLVARLKKGMVNKIYKKTLVPEKPTQNYGFPNRATKEAAVSAAERKLEAVQSRLAKLKDGSALEYGTLTLPATTGEFGVLRYTSVKVFQVVDKSSLIVRIAGQDVMLRGMSTADVADDAVVGLGMPLEAIGTTTYTTVLGASRTIPVLRPLDTTAIEKALTKPR